VRREIKILEKMNHSNIVRLYEAFDDAKQVFLINEYCGGGSLHSLLKMKQNRQLRECEARPLFK
jgi:serine/threonine protein kinase